MFRYYRPFLLSISMILPVSCSIFYWRFLIWDVKSLTLFSYKVSYYFNYSLSLFKFSWTVFRALCPNKGFSYLKAIVFTSFYSYTIVFFCEVKILTNMILFLYVVSRSKSRSARLALLKSLSS